MQKFLFLMFRICLWTKCVQNVLFKSLSVPSNTAVLRCDAATLGGFAVAHRGLFNSNAIKRVHVLFNTFVTNTLTNIYVSNRIEFSDRNQIWMILYLLMLTFEEKSEIPSAYIFYFP